MIAIWWLAIAGAWELPEFPKTVFPTTEAIPITLPDEPAPGLTLAETEDAVRWAIDQWNSVDCVGDLRLEEAGSAPSVATFDLGDPANQITVGDLSDSLDSDLAAATLVNAFGVAYSVGGETFLWADNIDIGINDDVVFATHADVQSGQCSDAYDLAAVMTHEFGHFLGIAHSGDATAAMYWPSITTCDPTAATLSDDDKAALQFMYGGTPHTLACEGRVGEAPRVVSCEMSFATPENVTSIEWDFGDGSTGTGDIVEHTYDAVGEYIITACANGNAACGAPPSCTTRIVSVCAGTPLPLPRVTATVDPLIVQLLNDTKLEAVDCLDEVTWTITDAEGELVAESALWEPRIPLPAPGTYTGTLEVAGPLGSETAEFSLDTRTLKPVKGAESNSKGCAHANQTGHQTALALLVLVGIRRRRP